MQSHVQAITLLFGAYGQAKDVNRIKIYCQTLKDVPKELLLSVVQKSMLECKYLPSIAELAEACRSLNETMSGKSEVPTWGEAWREIDRAMHLTAWGHRPKFSHPAIAAAVDQYGWHDLQTCLADDINTVRAQVRRMYEDSARRYIEQKKNTDILSRNPALAASAKGLLEKHS